MKTLSLLTLCFLVAISPTFANDEKPELIKIQTVDGKSVWITKEVLKTTFYETFGTPKPKLTPVEKARLGIQVRQEAFKWAYSANGANLSNTEAQAFAEEMASRENPAEALKAYTATYAFAYSNSGLNLSAAEARKIAEKFSQLESALDLLELFKTAYRDAYSTNGMNMSAAEALKYALKQVGLK